MHDIAKVREFLTGEHDSAEPLKGEKGLYIVFCDGLSPVIAVVLQPDGVLRVLFSHTLPPHNWKGAAAAYARLSAFEGASEQYRKEGAQ